MTSCDFPCKNHVHCVRKNTFRSRRAGKSAPSAGEALIQTQPPSSAPPDGEATRAVAGVRLAESNYFVGTSMSNVFEPLAIVVVRVLDSGVWYFFGTWL